MGVGQRAYAIHARVRHGGDGAARDDAHARDGNAHARACGRDDALVVQKSRALIKGRVVHEGSRFRGLRR